MKPSIVCRILLSIAVLATPAAFGAGSLGELRPAAPLDGTGAADSGPGQRLENPALVQTEDQGVTTWLDNGRTLEIAPHSTVHLEADASGTVQVSVRRGGASVTDSRGQEFTAGKNSYFHLTPAKRMPSVAPTSVGVTSSAETDGPGDDARRSRARGAARETRQR